MAMNQATGGYVLPCGRDLELVWQHLEIGAKDDHDLGCRHCDTARGSLQALREATRALAEDDVAPPPDLTSRIMTAVRAEIRRGNTVDLATSEPGQVEVSTRAVAVVLRYAADGVAGVRARRCRIRPVGTDEFGASEVDVELSIAVSHHSTAEHVWNAVRERVSAAAAARVGLRVVRLDLIVDDLYDI